MPESDRARLGSRHIRFDAAVAHFLPGRLESWRGVRAITLPYAQMTSVLMTEPKARARGRLIVRTESGESYEMAFGSGKLSRMTRTYRELWRRVAEARGDGPDSCR
jgi:hypothetical protein